MNIILYGKSCVGKSSVKNYLTENFRYESAITFTTREPRDGEVDGVDYHFVTKEKFIEMYRSGILCCVTRFDGEYYGVDINDLKRHNMVFILDHSGVREFMNDAYYKAGDGTPSDKVLIVEICADDRIIDRRMDKRNMRDKQKKQRKFEDEISYKKGPSYEEIEYWKDNMYTIENNQDIENTVGEILKIIAVRG